MSINPEQRHTNPDIAEATHELKALHAQPSVIPPEENRDSATPKVSSWDVRPVGPAASTTPEQGKKLDWKKPAAVVALLGAIGAGAFIAKGSSGGGSAGDHNTRSQATSQNANLNPGETLGNFVTPDLVKYANGALETANEESWGNMVNEGLVPQLQWYFDALLANPSHMDEVPTKSFTENPNSEIVNAMKTTAKQILAENPGAIDILGVVDPIATEKFGGTSNDGFSMFMKDPENNPGLSTLRLDYSVQSKDGAIKDEPSIGINLEESYKVTQAQDGSIRIN